MIRRKEKYNYKKEIKNKRQTGITLIALVITIIILLILAGVTINIIINEGLIRQAQNATDMYEKAQREELNSIDNIVAKMNAVGGNSNNPNNPSNPGENTVDPDNPTQPDVPPQTPEENLAEIAQPGDYVRYAVPEKTFTVTTEQTGYENEQTYNTGDYTGLWQILYNDEEHGLQIISADDITNGKKLYLKGEVGYNKSVGTLNSFCSNYVNSEYAASGRCVGSNPTHPEGITEFYEGSYEYIKTYIEYYGNMIKADTGYESDFNALKGATHQNADGIWNINNNQYWMASRTVNSNESDTYFFVYDVDTAGNMSGWSLLRVQSSYTINQHSAADAVRAVITLKPGIKTNNGTGSSESPYELVK